MRLLKTLILTLLLCFGFQSLALAVETTNGESMTKNSDILVIELKDGKVYAELFADKAPNHVQRITELANEKFYDGVVFHRVIDGFMAQTGDPSGTGMGGSKKPNLKAEFNDVKHERGILSMARSSDPNSANSQFFIMLASSPHLDGQYTAWGRVIKGMEYVDKIKLGDARKNGMVTDPDRMISVRVISRAEFDDMQKAEKKG
jgi:cyclophilin family peptidyl-prolyl cis-trans isomerase